MDDILNRIESVVVLLRYDHEHPSSCMRLFQKHKRIIRYQKSLPKIIERKDFKNMSLLTGKIITSDIQFAGTDAGVTLWLYDEDGRESGPIEIDSLSDEDIMERGDVDDFR